MRAHALAACRSQLATAGTFADIQKAVRTGARRLVDCDGATLVLRDGDRCFYADEDAIAPLWRGQRFPIDECISGWAMLHGRPAVVPDIDVDERIPLAAYRTTFVRSLAMVPIGREFPVGAIGVYWAQPRLAGPHEIGLLEHLAAAADEAIDRVGLDQAPVAPRFGLV